MALDLTSLLNSHISSDDEDEDYDNGNRNSIHHRTVDEILQDPDSDSDSSSSSSPRSPSSSILRPSNPNSPVRSSQAAVLATKSDGARSVESRKRQVDSFSRFNSGESLPGDFLRRASKPLPSLFGGVRSNVKPGAALAAAAAASRSVPSPHAAAIKSRRSLGSDGLRRVLDSSELGLDPIGSLSSAGSESSLSMGKSVEDSNGRDDEAVESLLEVVGVRRHDEAVESEVGESVDVCTEPHNDFSSEDAEKHDALDENSHVSYVNGTENNLESAPTLEDNEDSRNAELESGLPLEDDVHDVSGEEDVNGEIDELVEERLGQLESRIVGQRLEKKKALPRPKPLDLAEELEKRRASTGLHWEEGAAAQPMRLEGVRRGSIMLGYFDIDANNIITVSVSSQVLRRDYGSPQVLAVHPNYIAVGMARGVILVSPSRYSAYNADAMEAKMIMLGLQGDRSFAAVTSICFNQQGDLLLAGYGDGHITIWDVQKSSALKVITGEHTAPVVHALFLGQDALVTRQFKAVTGDSKGLVLLHSSSVVPLLNRFSIKTQCLLDGQSTGTVLSASPLLFDESLGTSSVSTQGNTSSSSFVEEGVIILATYQTALVVRLSPSLEVYAQISRPEGVREGSMPYTAWKCSTQMQNLTTERVGLLAIAWDRKVQVAKLVKSELKVYGGWSLDSPAIGVAWLDDQMLVALTVTGQLYLCANDGTVIHQTSFSVDVSPGEDLVSYHTYFNNVFGNPEKAYHNCLAVRGASVYILGPAHLIVSRLLPWKERIQVLRKAGDWMGSLNMAMMIYDGEAHGVVDLPRSLDAVQETVMPYLEELLHAYVEEVFSYISVAFCNQIEKMEESNTLKEQYTRVGGVAVEFCVHINKTDILFDDIFNKFIGVKQKDSFLELLEPYILRDMLGSLSPEIMQALVEHYISKGWVQRVEQCVLHMDISSLDFNQVEKLCWKHGLYGALFYLYNKGLNDFTTPLEGLLDVLRESKGEVEKAIGYRVLVYLKYCFSGIAFPPGQGTLPPSNLPSIKENLLRFLLDTPSPKSGDKSSIPSSEENSPSPKSKAEVNLYPLLRLDTEATLDVLRCAFAETGISDPESSSLNLLVRDTVNVLIRILDKNISEALDGELNREVTYLFEFVAHYVACGRVKVSREVLRQILEYLTSGNLASADSENNIILKGREKQVLALIKVVSEADWDASHVLSLCEKAHFYQVCGLIHKTGHRYLAALDSYLKDVDEPVHAFSFINSALTELNGDDAAIFQSEVIKRIPELVVLNREAAFFLVIDQFNEEASPILTEMRAHPESTFLYLKTVIEVHLSGSLNFDWLPKDAAEESEELKVYLEKISNYPKLLRNNTVQVTDDITELYLELLCQYEPGSVLKFLETFDSYRVEHCLRLCQEHKVVDAATFLLERVGDVGSALLLTLSSLNDKFAKLAGAVSTERFRSTKNIKEVEDIESVLFACIGLCQRNTPRLNPEESEMLWFRLLDSFCETLMGSSDGQVDTSTVRQDRYDEDSIITWRITRSHKNANILRKLFSQFIKEIVEGMIGYVRLPKIMSKLLSDNGAQEFGDFKLTILGMLGTYGFERRILDTAKSLIEDDSYYTMSLLKKGASHGYAPRSQTCCICNGQLAKSASISSIRVFNCGHATHLQCEALESGTSSGCPVCTPNKKSQRSQNKSVFVENGLVKKVSSKPHQIHAFPHDIDSSEHAYGFQQMSRFEMLNMLQNDQRVVQVENVPHLRLAPPAIYHEKVKKGTRLLAGESSGNMAATEKQSRNKKLKDLKVRGSSLRFPLKSSIFGKEKISKR